MIQLNLLPDVKLEYIRAQRTKRMTMVIAILVSGVSVALLVLLLSVSGLQKKHLSDLNKDIASGQAELKAKPQISKILTVQNQLSSLTELHEKKPATSRLFEYLNQVTPAQVDITSFTINFTDNTATVTGTTDALSSVNQYIDTLKFTTFKLEGEEGDGAKAFSNVVMSSFSVSDGDTGNQSAGKANYTISLTYDTAIFDITQKVKLNVPKQVTTRSELDQPTDLFQAAPEQTEPGGDS